MVDPPVGQPASIFARTWFPAAARLMEKLPPEARARLDPGFVAMAEQGARYGRAEIQDAMLERGELGVAMQGFFADYDLLVTPTTALPAFPVGLEHPDQGEERWSDWAGFSYPFNLTQQPAITRAGRVHRRRAAGRPADRRARNTPRRWCCERPGRSRPPARSRCPRRRWGSRFDSAWGRMLGSPQRRRGDAPGARE